MTMYKILKQMRIRHWLFSDQESFDRLAESNVKQDYFTRLPYDP